MDWALVWNHVNGLGTCLEPCEWTGHLHLCTLLLLDKLYWRGGWEGDNDVI